MTTIAIIAIAAVCAEHSTSGYFIRAKAKRKRRLWLPYALFGVVGYVLLALRTPVYHSSLYEARIAPRRGYTHTGFARPEEEMDEFIVETKRRVAPLSGYHVPRGALASRSR